jgi:hypothetical protein
LTLVKSMRQKWTNFTLHPLDKLTNPLPNRTEKAPCEVQILSPRLFNFWVEEKKKYFRGIASPRSPCTPIAYQFSCYRDNFLAVISVAPGMSRRCCRT